MKLMIAMELGSTAAAEMSVFQRLFAGKGTKPPRLAPCPIDMLLQLEPCGEAVTWSLTLLDVLLPGAGLTTVTANVPAEDAAPVAVSCVAETNVVWSGVVPRSTWAPFANLLPVTVSVKPPVPVLAGLMPVSTGVGFISVTLLGPLTEEFATLVARTVIVLGLGRVEGAV